VVVDLVNTWSGVLRSLLVLVSTPRTCCSRLMRSALNAAAGRTLGTYAVLSLPCLLFVLFK